MKTLVDLKDERTLEKNIQFLERHCDRFKEEACDKNDSTVVGLYDFILYYMKANNEILRQMLKMLSQLNDNK